MQDSGDRSDRAGASTVDVSDVLPRVQGYRTERLIGRGGMGSVYLAQDVTLGRLVAIKILRDVTTGDSTVRRLFLREACAMAAVEHPNIVRVYACGESEAGSYLAMEYVDGESLAARIDRRAPIPDHEALGITRQVVHALDAAWRKQLIHRDVKPSNILLDREDRVHLTDFGLARSVLVDRTSMAARTHFQGTARYMSPEQVVGEPVTDFRADMYALGIVLFEMLTGASPFDGPDLETIVSHQLSDPLPSPRELRATVSQGVADLCRWLTEKEAAARPGSYGELDARIGELLARVDTGVVRPSSLRSIAVLPMTDLSREHDQDHFCEGLAEEIINALVKIRGLAVASRTSAFRFKNQPVDIREIGRQLGVETVLEGSVRTDHDRLRITAELIDVATGFHIWSERYDCELHDVFAVQDEITARIVDALKISLTSEEQAAIRGGHVRNIRAYDFYLRGRKYFWELTGPSLRIARAMLQRAVDIEPQYALAHAALAETCAFLYMYVDTDATYLGEADQASRRALAIHPNLAEAHIARGFVLSLAGRYNEADAHFEAAIPLSPTSFDAYYLYGRACVPRGEMEKAARLFEKAHEVRPDSYLASQMLRMVYERLGREAEATAAAHRTLALVERTLDTAPTDARALYTGAQNAVIVGRTELGLDWARRLLALAPDDPTVYYNVACVFSLAEEIDEGVELFRKAVECGFAHPEWAEHDPDLDALRSHPEFRRILASLR